MTEMMAADVGADARPAQPRYRIPAGIHRVEEEIKRSRFITTVGPAPTVEAARALIADVSAEFADASHNCWAYVVGPPGSTAQIGMSDDREPHGTAGRPMLNVLLHSGIGDIAAVVTRYFGGTLLGKGGLVKAYSGGVQLALESLPTVELIPKSIVSLVVDYSAVTPIKRLIAEASAEVVHEEYAADVSYRILLPTENADDFAARIIDLTGGNALVEVEPESA
jgi:uncharacterized YigZ family protein